MKEYTFKVRVVTRFQQTYINTVKYTENSWLRAFNRAEKFAYEAHGYNFIQHLEIQEI
jgi:hypothetical protein